MKLTTLISSTLLGAALAAAAPAQALPIQSLGGGSAVAQADFSADFSGLFDHASTAYEEGGLLFAAGGGPGNGIYCQQTLCNHPGFAGMSGGIYYDAGPYAEVRGINGEIFLGFETVVGAGHVFPAIHGVWETWLAGVLTGTGTFAATPGAVVGLYDRQGFDLVRIGAYEPGSANTAFGAGGATAIDNVRMQLAPAEVPEPGSVILSGLALAFAALVRRLRRRRG